MLSTSVRASQSTRAKPGCAYRVSTISSEREAGSRGLRSTIEAWIVLTWLNSEIARRRPTARPEQIEAVLSSQVLLSGRDPSKPQVRLTLAFSCEAVWRGPGQTQRLLGPTALSIPWRPALRRRDGQGVAGTGVARQSHLCQGRDRPDRQLQRLVRRPASAIDGF